REVNLGLPFDVALENMVQRVKSEDFELMATAIAIQHQVGGNLAEILDSIAFTIRERIRIKGEIRTLTAQQRLSGYVVGLLPFGRAGSRQEDPLKARLNQLGQMTAKDLQELELQQPFFDRTIKPLAGRLSGAVARITSSSFSERTEKRLAMAGNPGDMKVADWL